MAEHSEHSEHIVSPKVYMVIFLALIVGTTLTVPLHDRTAAHAVAAIQDSGLAVSAISTRRPTLDDVYLRLTGARLADAA